jgi:hypothetical protein
MSRTGPAAAICATATSATRANPGRVLRRTLVQVVLTGGVIAFAIPPAPAQQKMSQIDAEYQDEPKSALSCAACSLFRLPRSCEVVEGDISPDGWCKFFDLPD